MHAKNDEIEEADVERSFYVAVKSTRRRGSQRPGKRPGIPLKWCPVVFFCNGPYAKASGQQTSH